MVAAVAVVVVQGEQSSEYYQKPVILAGQCSILVAVVQQSLPGSDQEHN